MTASPAPQASASRLAAAAIPAATEAHATAETLTRRDLLVRWGMVAAAVSGILLTPVPEGIGAKSCRLLAISLGTMVGSIVRPVPIYFYAHYAFASITARAVLSLAAVSNLSASLTHFGTTPGPIFFGARCVTRHEWWTYGFVVSLMTIAIWGTIGVARWKTLGWW